MAIRPTWIDTSPCSARILVVETTLTVRPIFPAASSASATRSGSWHDQMASFTAVTTERVTTERVTAGGATAPDVDPAALGAALTWLGERLHYLATLDVAPFNDEDTLVGVLTHIWMTSLYGEPEAQAPRFGVLTGPATGEPPCRVPWVCAAVFRPPGLPDYH
ncbi:hypothetical protein [Nonomuraea sp. NPDC049607]|uniref:hypothetical protein n=1 Tax=Nonomuraea sp. NPDC049607 TaxID=3154732 RepID=UPI003424A808